MDDMMGMALQAAFGHIIEESIKPVIYRLTEIEGALNLLLTKVSKLESDIDKVRNGGGILGRALGGG